MENDALVHRGGLKGYFHTVPVNTGHSEKVGLMLAQRPRRPTLVQCPYRDSGPT